MSEVKNIIQGQRTNGHSPLTDATNLIKYNYLNLPETVTKGNNSIRYIYDATGRKLSQVTTFGGQAKQVDYAGEFQYENDVLQFLSHEEGRIVVSKETAVFVNSCDNTSGLATVGSVSMATQTINNEKYVKVTSTGTTSNSGITTMGATLQVVSGDKYKIRAKGYSITKPASLRIKVGATDVSWPGAALPIGANTESWTEQIVTFTTSGDLTVGIAWQTPVNGDILYINEFEITRLATQAPEYQYHLKDHLGNTRITFTTVDHSETKTATLESATIAQDKANFLRYDNTKRIKAAIFNRTNSAGAEYSQRLAGGGTTSNERYGMAKSIAVMPGDVVTMDVYVKYVDRTQSGQWSGALATLMGQILSGTAGVVTEGGAYATSYSSFPADYILDNSGSTSSAPKIFLNYITFDKNFVPILTDSSQTNFRRITTAAKETGTDVPHVKLTATVTVKQAGYMYIYYSNEESSLNYEAFFDDFTVTHTKSPVIQAEDYYPFGLVASSYRRENSLTNRWKFQGQEHVDDLNLGWDSFKWRNHQPEIGRFFNIDPISEKYFYNSPYAFSENRVIDGVELEGLEYVRFDILVLNGRVNKIATTKDYELKNPNTKGPGIEYNYIYVNVTENPKGNGTISITNKFVKNMYGIYQGPNNPQLPEIGGSPNNLKDDYSLDPIDETDANAKQHDLDYDKDNLKGLKGVLDSRSTEANEDYIERANKTIDKNKNGENDSVTGKPVTEEAKKAAEFGKNAFETVEIIKKTEIEKAH